jgi:hypothetical protein
MILSEGSDVRLDLGPTGTRLFRRFKPSPHRGRREVESLGDDPLRYDEPDVRD